MGLAHIAAPVANVPVSSFDPYDQDVLIDPYPYYEELRDAGPVVWLERYGVFALPCYREVKMVLDDPLTYGSSGGAGLTNFHTTKPWRTPSLLLEADPPEHVRTRQQMMRVMTPGAARQLRPRFEAQAHEMVQALLAKGECDGITDLAEAYPLKVFGDAVGLRASGREHLLPYGDMVFNGFGAANERFKQSLARMKEAPAWIADACRREALTKDGFGAQLYSGVDRGEITEEEAGLLVRSLLSAGLDTTVFTLGNALVNFARFPDQWEILKQKPELARQAVEEILRYDGTFHSFYRTTSKPVKIAGVKMEKNQKILLLTASANRDPQKWSNPDRLDITHRANGHLAFGHGIHACAGQMLARLEGEVVLTALAKNVDRIELRGEPVMHFNNTVRGYKSIPLRVTPRAAG